MSDEAKNAADAVIGDITKAAEPTAPPAEPEKATEAPAAPVPPKPAPKKDYAGALDRGGVPFDPDVHAAQKDGSPKTDSIGRYILKEHDYSPRTPNVPGGK